MNSIKSNYSQKLNNFFFLLLTTLITLFIFIPSCTRTVYKNFHAQTATNVRSSLPTRLTSNFYTNYPSALQRKYCSGQRTIEIQFSRSIASTEFEVVNKPIQETILIGISRISCCITEQ